MLQAASHITSAMAANAMTVLDEIDPSVGDDHAEDIFRTFFLGHDGEFHGVGPIKKREGVFPA